MAHRIFIIFAILIAANALISCSYDALTHREIEERFSVSAERRLSFTDALINKRGLVYVSHGGRSAGNFPSESELIEIQHIERILNQRGYQTTSSKSAADYILHTTVPYWFSEVTPCTFSVSLVKLYKTPRARLAAGGDRKGMWSARLSIWTQTEEQTESYKLRVFARLLSMMHQRVEQQQFPLEQL
ncbi:hypothetical protein JIN77_14740 [Verrucomicrobiaceae bacterium R5-34]|nr:hypothetical protein [Verrucomicrobiaceae bacterium R5-34]